MESAPTSTLLSFGSSASGARRLSRCFVADVNLRNVAECEGIHRAVGVAARELLLASVFALLGNNVRIEEAIVCVCERAEVIKDPLAPIWCFVSVDCGLNGS